MHSAKLHNAPHDAKLYKVHNHGKFLQNYSKCRIMQLFTMHNFQIGLAHLWTDFQFID